MLSQEQLDNLKTTKDCDDLAQQKWKQIAECVGWLWPDILRSEIEQIVQRRSILFQKERDNAS